MTLVCRSLIPGYNFCSKKTFIYMLSGSLNATGLKKPPLRWIMHIQAAVVSSHNIHPTDTTQLTISCVMAIINDRHLASSRRRCGRRVARTEQFCIAFPVLLLPLCKLHTPCYITTTISTQQCLVFSFSGLTILVWWKEANQSVIACRSTQSITQVIWTQCQVWKCGIMFCNYRNDLLVRPIRLSTEIKTTIHGLIHKMYNHN